MSEERILSKIGDVQFLDLGDQRRSWHAQQFGSSRLISTRFFENPNDDYALDRPQDRLERFGDMVADLIGQGFDELLRRLRSPADSRSDAHLAQVDCSCPHFLAIVHGSKAGGAQRSFEEGILIPIHRSSSVLEGGVLWERGDGSGLSRPCTKRTP